MSVAKTGSIAELKAQQHCLMKKSQIKAMQQQNHIATA